MAASWPLLFLVVVSLNFSAVSMEELQQEQLQETPEAIDPERMTKDIFTTAQECDPLNGGCPAVASGPMDPEHSHAEAELSNAGMEALDKEDVVEDQWKKPMVDKTGADVISDDDDDDESEEYYEGSSVISGGEQSGHGALTGQPVEGEPGATHEIGVVTSGPEGSDVIDSQSAQKKVDSNATAGEHSPETEKKKVPLREILLRLKPASLMDDEEREAAAAAAAADRGEQDTNGTTAGTVDSRSLALGGALPSDDASNNAPATNASKRAVCAVTPTEDTVQLLNATGVQALVSPNANSTGRGLPAPCLLVFFFSPQCRFSTAAAPAMTALARALKGIMPVYGVDSVQHHSINAQYAVMGTPQLLLFHNSYSVAHYNASSFTPDHLTSFLHHYTDHRLQEEFDITEEDLKDGPLPLKASPGGGWWLAASWLLLGGVAGRCFVKSALCHRLVEAVLNSWREAEAQHQHQD